jgi:maleate isomerase
MSSGKHAYGALGRIGVGTPQANPTVEPEFDILLPRACSVHVTRLTSGAASPEHRLMQYLWNLERFLAAFDELRPDVFGFACTGSSYLVGAIEEERLINAAQASYGYPVATAARAIIWGLSRLRARRIAMIAPYSDTLIAKAKEYWSDAGLEIVRSLRIPTASTDTRSIYALGSERLAGALREIATDGVDAVLVCGTGLASLRAIRDCELNIPVVSSNVCLAGQVLALAGHAELLEPDSPFPQRWRERLGEALAP